MSRSRGRATAQNFAEFAQNLEMCTPKLENSWIFTIFTCFCTFYVTFRVFCVHFLAQFFLKLSFGRAKKSTFRMSVAEVLKKLKMYFLIALSPPINHKILLQFYKLNVALLAMGTKLC